MRLAFLLVLLSASASAQTARPVQPVVTLGVGPAVDSDGLLLAGRLSAGARRGAATGRLRGTVATSLDTSPGFRSTIRRRWEAAALGGVVLGDRTQVFAGAGPALSGGRERPGCLDQVCPDEPFPTALGLALGLDVAFRVRGAARVGVQASATLNASQSMAGLGLLIGFGR